MDTIVCKKNLLCADVVERQTLIPGTTRGLAKAANAAAGIVESMLSTRQVAQHFLSNDTEQMYVHRNSSALVRGGYLELNKLKASS